MIKKYHSEVVALYEKIREEELNTLKKRREEIYQALPQVLELEQQIGKLCISLSLSTLKHVEHRETYLKQLKEEMTDLRMKKSELLVAHGYPMDYLELKYQCNKCKDTGFTGTDRCPCYRQKLVEAYYKGSDLKQMLLEHNFNYFKLDLYPAKRTESETESPRKNMEKILSRSLQFIKQFDEVHENHLFYGNSGTGKTFLSHCIAKELLDRGYLVIYRTSEELIKDLKTIRFQGNDDLEELLISCDLLIVDDLGTEQISDFSRTELFNLLNKKLLKQKKMLVSTNLSLESLLKTYSERITSRLLGNFTLNKFYGDDIRIKINLNKIK